LFVTHLAVVVELRSGSVDEGRTDGRKEKLKSGVGKVEFFITATTEYEKRRTFVAVYVKHTTGIHIVTAASSPGRR
jgi:hypothetical protein